MRHLVKILIISLLMAIFCVKSGWAATIYVPDDYPNISTGIAALQPGDTLIVKNGIYKGEENRITNVPSGSSSALTRICSETLGGAILDGSDTGIHITSGSYIRIEGFKCTGGAVVRISGSENDLREYIEIKRVGVATSGDVHGYDFSIHGARYCLFEECWGWGTAKSIFHATGGYTDNDPCQFNVWRRCVARVDNGDAVNGFQCYGRLVTDNIFENCIAIDFSQTCTDTVAGFRCRADNARNKYYGCIALNLGTKFHGYAIEATDTEYINCIAAGCNYGWNLTHAYSGELLDQCTSFGNSGYGYRTSAQLLCKNSIGLSNSTQVSGGRYEYCWFYQPAENIGSNCKTEPIALLYLPRSPDPNTGEAGKKRGATIEKRYENGILTEQALWPFPNEDKIKSDMSETSTRGFCAENMTLTKYIWEYLGNPIPSDIYGQSNVYYVSSTGSDGSDGKTIETAWRTLQHAADSVAAGDTVVVLSGEYQGFYVTKNGTPDKRITFECRGDVVVRGCVEYDGRLASIHVLGDNISIVGFRCFPSDAENSRGIRISGFPDNHIEGVTVRNCEIINAGSRGITSSYADNLLVENNVVRGSLRSHGIYLANSGDNPIVRNNTCYSNYKAGIQLNADMELPGDHIISGALIEGNVLYDNGEGGSAALDLASVRDSIIRNNLLYSNKSQGISNWDDGYSDWGDPGNYTYGCKNNVYANNTVIMPAGSRHALSFRNGSTGNVVKNNILIHLGSADSIAVDSESLSGLVSDYNIVTRFENTNGNLVSLDTWRSSYGLDVHSFVAAAEDIFKNVGNNDYDLSSESVAVDKGTPIESVVKDILGRDRPKGNGYDIGAYECQDCQGGEVDTTPPSDVSNFRIALFVRIVVGLNET